jgi:putative nucleotidyltransferase with HDIG domain
VKQKRIKYIEPGLFTARPIYINDELLLDKESFLTETLIDKLRKRGVEKIWIKDNSELSDYEKQTFLDNSYNRLLKRTVSILNKGRDNEDIDIEALGSTVRQILDSLKFDSDILLNLITLKEEDDYLFTHSVNVSFLAMMIGITLGLPDNELRSLGTGALLHDIGLLEIPSRIRNSQNSLSPEETDLLKQHPSIGATKLMDYDDIDVESVNIIYQHHERCDGSGYPEKLIGEQISKMAKIVAVADSYEAMTHDRAYRKKYSGYQALKHLLPLSGSLYDSYYLQAFLKFMPIFPIGSLVLLNNRAIGKVMASGANVFRPVVELVYDSAGKAFRESRKIDLSRIENSLLYITRVMTMDEVMDLIMPSAAGE